MSQIVESSALEWKIYLPMLSPRIIIAGQRSIADSDFLDELSEFRGRVFYAKGRRPSFLKSTGQFEDRDSLDPVSYHVAVRESGRLVGCVRVTPLEAEGRQAFVRKPEDLRLNQFIHSLDIPADCLGKGSRWVVDPDFRGKMGSKLIYTALFIGKELGFKLIFACCGTRDNQDKIMTHLGFHHVEGIKNHYSEVFDDEIAALYFSFDQVGNAAIRQSLPGLACVEEPGLAPSIRATGKGRSLRTVEVPEGLEFS